MSDQQTLTGLTNVAQHLARILIEHCRAQRDRQNQIRARFARTIATAPGLAVVGAETSSVAIVDHGVEGVIALQQDGAAVAAVTAIRATLGHEFLTPKAHTAVSAFPCAHFNCGFINKFHSWPVAVAKKNLAG